MDSRDVRTRPRFRLIARRSIAAFLALGVVGWWTADAAGAATSDEVREGPQFYSGSIIDVAGDVDGDVYASGQSVTISGDVTGDVIAVAQTISITGTVSGDVRLAAQAVTVSGTVTGSASVAAATLAVAPSGSFEKDIVAAAGDVALGGEVGRDVILSVGTLAIDGSVGGRVAYVSDREARITDGAVAGVVERIAPPEARSADISPWSVVAGWLLGVLYALVAMSVTMLAAGLLIPKWLTRVTDQLMPSPWKALLVGVVASLALPLALLLIALTIVGAPLALALALAWFVLTAAAFVFSSAYIGRLLFRDRRPPVVSVLVGGAILVVGLQIPWFNVLIWFAMVFFGLGAQLLAFAAERPWREVGEPRPSASVHSAAARPVEPST
ncbi:polymer-forming cytoskeletal protein [Microbacterium oleivorans]|uniref:bactofilin family protein n=1 Tax=Microbacterium oleivorans TaxID=273677 RepID=UPI0010A2B98C|nr:polymer-forming cytoskeletal protein [Microbacterium oleivorans]THE07507.1 polymer-forming cytoskeletal protein [Microbacterium oleivorans]